MLRALVVVTIGLLLSGCALDAMGRGTPSWSAPPPAKAKPVKAIKVAAVVPAPVAEPVPKRTVKQGKPKPKKEKHWYTPWR